MPETEKKLNQQRRDDQMLAFREEILEAATGLFAEQGFSDAVTQALADKLQIAKGTIYRHFPSKRDLYLAVIDRVMRKLQERVETNILGITDGFERVTTAVTAFLAFFAEYPHYVELLLQERAYFKDRRRPTYFEHREHDIERWRQVYRELIAAGRVREMPAEQITKVVENVLYGTMVDNHSDGQPKPSDVQAKEILDVIFPGVMTERERRSRMGLTFDVAGTPASSPETDTSLIHELQARIDELTGRLDEQARANDELKSALIAQSNSRRLMCETYEGVVADVDGDRVIVVYDVNGNIVEQCYERSQFLDRSLPEVDTELVACIVVAEIEPRAAEPAPEEDERRGDVSSSQRKPLTGPTVF